MAQIVVRNIPEEIMEALRRLARNRGCSVEQEVRDLIAAAAERVERRERFRDAAAAFRARLLERGRTFSDSAELVREDRER